MYGCSIFFLIWVAKDTNSYITVALWRISPLFDDWGIWLAVSDSEHDQTNTPPDLCLWQGSVNGDYVATIEHFT